MKMQAAKRGLYAVVGAVALVGATYWYTSSVKAQPITQISGSACSIQSPGGSVGLPLNLIRQSAGTAAFTVGPLSASGLDWPVTLRFDPQISGTERQVVRSGSEIRLPVAYGRAQAVPERITLTCRDNGIAQVRYQAGGRTLTSFDVIVEPVGVASEDVPSG